MQYGRLSTFRHCARALVFGALVSAMVAAAVQARAAERVYYIAAEEGDWNYAPVGRDLMMDRPFSANQAIFVVPGPGRVGATYRKARYIAYTDAEFTQKRDRPAAWEHLGVLGPVIHAEVGDTIKIVFRNKASRPYSIHPHGVFYSKANEGVPYADGTGAAAHGDDAVAPGATYTYRWEVPESAGPGPGDPSSIAWPYHSHVNEPRDTNSGLVGAIIVTAKGKARADGRPADVDREFVTLFTIFDENQSWYLDDNVARFARPGTADPEAFEESNLMHSINGYVFANLPGLTLKMGDRARWYLMSLGTEVDLHTPHWHGQTVLASGRRVDVVNLLPATSLVADMRADNPGTWMFHCHVNDHIAAGMTALYTITP